MVFTLKNRARCETNGHDLSLPLKPRRVFLLSPANRTGIRAAQIVNPKSDLELAQRLRAGTASLGELFTFMSGLYFRGKLAYARAFASATPELAGSFIITASGGLVSPETLVTLEYLREISAIDIDPSDARYRTPLDRDLRQLSSLLGADGEIVLLGSIATPKYAEPLLAAFGKRLVFPADFVGRGDMSRGGLMLRCALAGTELVYVPLLEAQRRGRRPPKLAPLAHIRASL